MSKLNVELVDISVSAIDDTSSENMRLTCFCNLRFYQKRLYAAVTEETFPASLLGNLELAPLDCKLSLGV